MHNLVPDFHRHMTKNFTVYIQAILKRNSTLSASHVIYTSFALELPRIQLYIREKKCMSIE